MKRLISLLLILCLALPAAVLADGAPSSQFGFRGWPYRQGENGCSAGCSLGCGQCRGDGDCVQCPYCQSALCTACPAPTGTPAPTTAPTRAPALSPRPSSAPAATPSVSTGDYTTISLTTQEQKVWNLLNESRAANGLHALPLDAALCRLARLKCQDMNDLGYFAHESPTYGSAASMLREFGYAFSGVGENIAHHANVEKADAAFMSSPGHRGNILGRQWTRVGVGVCVDKNGFVYVTQLFAR